MGLISKLLRKVFSIVSFLPRMLRKIFRRGRI